MELKVRIYINTDGKVRPWEALSEEEQKETGNALNDAALRAIGYIPFSEINKKREKHSDKHGN